MKKRSKQFVSLFSLLAFMFSCMSFGFTAGAETASFNKANNAANDTLTIIQEDTSLRKEYEKHFLMSDGSYTAAVYSEPIHRRANGSWVEVNNTLRLQTASDGTERYETVDGISDVSFAKNYQDRLVTMEQDGYSIAWGVEANTNTAPVLEAPAYRRSPAAEVTSANLSDLDTEEQKTLVDKSSSAVQYENAIAPNIDLEYIVLPSRVKESIILDSPQNITSYTVTVFTDGLSARLLDNREIEFFDSNNTVIFTMWAPYMYDSSSELSENISVALNETGDNLYEITMTPDSVWLNAPDRVYPVTIDPDVSVSRVRQNIIDTYVLQDNGNQNENLDRMYIGKKSGKTARAYLKYVTMPTISTDSTITRATQRLNILAGTTSANNASAYKVTGGNWDSGTITWANKPAAGTLIASNISHNNKSYYSFNCTNTVKEWYANSSTGKKANYGMMIRYYSESINDYNSFYSSDYATESKRPLMTISYNGGSGGNGSIAWPLPDNYTISSKWGYRNFDGAVHRGIDITGDGKTVVAAVPGTVSTFYDSSSGNSIIVTKTGSSFQTRYYHLKSYKVTSGTVRAGTAIGVSGSTGNVTGPHLHFQLQWGSDKYKSYNPLTTYHPNDKRSSWTNPNPNPMFVLEGGKYKPNNSFNYTYSANDYNDTSTKWKK